MRKEIAASRQSQTGAACHHIEYCMDKIQRAKSSVAIALPIESLNLEITTMMLSLIHILLLIYKSGFCLLECGFFSYLRQPKGYCRKHHHDFQLIQTSTETFRCEKSA